MQPSKKTLRGHAREGTESVHSKLVELGLEDSISASPIRLYTGNAINHPSIKANIEMDRKYFNNEATAQEIEAKFALVTVEQINKRVFQQRKVLTQSMENAISQAEYGAAKSSIYKEIREQCKNAKLEQFWQDHKHLMHTCTTNYKG